VQYFRNIEDETNLQTINSSTEELVYVLSVFEGLYHTAVKGGPMKEPKTS
jgi:hypothetical protein